MKKLISKTNFIKAIRTMGTIGVGASIGAICEYSINNYTTLALVLAISVIATSTISLKQLSTGE